MRMDCNCTAAAVAVPNWVEAAGSTLGLTPASIIALVSSFAGVGALSLLAVLPYCFRLCRGQDVITECLIGKSVVTFSIDATGNGLHAARKLVVDVNHRKMALADTGLAESPDHSTSDADKDKPVTVQNPAQSASERISS